MYIIYNVSTCNCLLHISFYFSFGNILKLHFRWKKYFFFNWEIGWFLSFVKLTISYKKIWLRNKTQQFLIASCNFSRKGWYTMLLPQENLKQLKIKHMVSQQYSISHEKIISYRQKKNLLPNDYLCTQKAARHVICPTKN